MLDMLTIHAVKLVGAALIIGMLAYPLCWAADRAYKQAIERMAKRATQENSDE